MIGAAFAPRVYQPFHWREWCWGIDKNGNGCRRLRRGELLTCAKHDALEQEARALWSTTRAPELGAQIEEPRPPGAVGQRVGLVIGTVRMHDGPPSIDDVEILRVPLYRKPER